MIMHAPRNLKPKPPYQPIPPNAEASCSHYFQTAKRYIYHSTNSLCYELGFQKLHAIKQKLQKRQLFLSFFLYVSYLVYHSIKIGTTFSRVQRTFPILSGLTSIKAKVARFVFSSKVMGGILHSLARGNPTEGDPTSLPYQNLSNGESAVILCDFNFHWGRRTNRAFANSLSRVEKLCGVSGDGFFLCGKFEWAYVAGNGGRGVPRHQA